MLKPLQKVTFFFTAGCRWVEMEDIVYEDYRHNIYVRVHFVNYYLFFEEFTTISKDCNAFLCQGPCQSRAGHRSVWGNLVSAYLCTGNHNLPSPSFSHLHTCVVVVGGH